MGNDNDDAADEDDDDDDEKDDYQYLSYLRQFNKRGPLNYHGLLFRLNRMSVVLLCAYVLNCDPMGGHDPCESFKLAMPQPPRPPPPPTRSAQSFFYLFSWIPRPRPRSSWRRKLKHGWISNVILAIFFVSAVLLVLDIVYLYKHEIGRLRLKRVQDLIQTYGPKRILEFAGNNNNNNNNKEQVSLGEYEQVLEKQIKETRRTLSYLGDRFISWGIINCGVYLYCLALCLSLYLLPQWLYAWMQRHDIAYNREIIDHKDEARRTDACCEDEVLKYLESNRVHAAIQAAKEAALRRETARSNSRGWGRRGTRRSIIDEKAHSCEASDSKICCLLTQMLTAGALRPLTRSSAWIERQNYAHIALNTLLAICGFLFAITASRTFYEKWPPANFDLGEASVCVIIALTGCAIIHHLVTFFVSCMTHVALVEHNSSLIYDCIARNERQMHRLHNAGQKHHAQEDIMKKVNSNYLFSLMTYKIFVKQLAPYRRALRGVFVIAFLMAFFVPVLLRLHVPYLAHDDNKGQQARKVRTYGLIMSLIILGPVNSICLPMCYLNARCQKLYKALVSLMAHIIAVRSDLSKDEEQHVESCCKFMYNRHAVRLLLKEISHPKQMLEQFAVNTLGSSASFSTLVRLHFWWGFLALSILVDTQESDQGNPLIAYLADPLGAWNFQVKIQ